MDCYVKQVYVLLLLLCTVTGCSGSLSSTSVATVEGNLQEGRKLIDSQDWSGALEKLNACLTGGGLNADLLAEALVKRARCFVELDKLSEAEADLSRAEMGTPPLADFHFTRGLLCMKQGKKADATAEFAKAKKLSPKLQIPK